MKKKNIQLITAAMILAFSLSACANNNQVPETDELPETETTLETEDIAVESETENPEFPLLETITGTITDIAEGEQDGEGRYLVLPEEGEETWYNYDKDTVFHNGAENAEINDTVEILCSGITARSYPPQSYAIEITLK